VTSIQKKGQSAIVGLPFVRAALWLSVLFLFVLPIAVQAQFTFTTNDGAITIAGYTGSDSTVIIPDATNGYPVTTIGDDAFYFCLSVTNVIIPNSVTSIGLESFFNCENLMAVKIPNCVTNIGAWAFWGCDSLTTVTIPASVTSVGSFAFLYCVSLSAVYFEGNAPNDGGGIFGNDSGVTVYYLPGTTGWGATFDGVPTVDETPPCEFAYVTNSDAVSIAITAYNGSGDAVAIPPNINGYRVTCIVAQAFQNDEVTNVFIPGSITNIGNSAFAACTGLTSIIIPNRVISIGSYAFAQCTNLTAAYFRGNAPPDNGTVFTGDPTTVYFLSGTSGWGGTFGGAPATEEAATPSYEFGYVTNDGAITITGYSGPGGFVVVPGTINGYSVTSVGQDAFFGDTNLVSVTLPASVTNIGDDAFAGCTSLASAYFQGDAPPDNETVFSGDPVTVYDLFGSTDWGTTFGGVPTIQETAPDGFTCVTNNDDVSITITSYIGPGGNVVTPNAINGYDVTSIGANSFIDDTNLIAVTIPSSVTSIDDGSFSGCTGLTNTVLPDSVISIGDGAFGGCSSLPNITIPDGVTSLGVGAFDACTNLSSIRIPGSVTNIGEIAFEYCISLTNFFVDADNPDYSSLNGALFDKPQDTLIQYPPGKTNASYTIPDGVITIAEGAFFFSRNLINATISGSVTNIVGPPFDFCNGITNIEVSATNPAYVSLNGVLFDKAEDVLVQYPPGITNVSYIIPNGVTTIQGDAFSGCTSLADLTLPDSVTNIGDWGTFLGCSRLASLVIPNGVTSIPDDAFSYCTSLATIVIPDTVTNIGMDAFTSCSNLTSVTIPDSVTDIGELAFYSCGNLTSAYFQGNPPADGGGAFGDTPAIVYYLPGTSGWGATFGNVPAVLWNPQAQNAFAGTGQFGFEITGPTNAVIVVQACTNLTNPVWIPVSTNTLDGNGVSSFSDEQSANSPRRFFRFSAE
jgi:hypothetical protein